MEDQRGTNKNYFVKLIFHSNLASNTAEQSILSRIETLESLSNLVSTWTERDYKRWAVKPEWIDLKFHNDRLPAA